MLKKDVASVHAYAGTTILACAVYIINALKPLHLLRYGLSMLARSAPSKPCLQHFTSMPAGSCVMEFGTAGCKQSEPPGCIIDEHPCMHDIGETLRIV